MEPQMTWPGWENVGLIGKGSFGAVYEIHRNVFGTVEKAALKVITIPQNSNDIEELKSDGYNAESIAGRYQDYLQDIVREYSLMATMKGNSNIVDCDDLHYEQQDNGYGWNIYIKMELLTPLTQVLEKDIPEEQVIKLATDMCNALILCKNRNVIHRDIKPQNIFVSPDGLYKLGDFGIAKVAERTANGTKTGTFRYMAPEVYNNLPYGFSADIYSLGIVLYWMLNERRTPFLPLPPQAPTAQAEDEARQRRFSGEPVPPPLHGSNELKRIVCKACAFSTEERYASATEMLADLKKLSGDGDASVSERDTVEEKSSVNNKTPEKTAAKKQVSEKSSGSSLKKFILIPIILIALAAVAAIVMFTSGKPTDEVSYPTERVMMSDATTLLRNEDVPGYVTDLKVRSKSENEKFGTYTAECSVTVNDNGEEETYSVSLVYEKEDDSWELSNLSKLK